MSLLCALECTLRSIVETIIGCDKLSLPASPPGAGPVDGYQCHTRLYPQADPAVQPNMDRRETQAMCQLAERDNFHDLNDAVINNTLNDLHSLRLSRSAEVASYEVTCPCGPQHDLGCFSEVTVGVNWQGCYSC